MTAVLEASGLGKQYGRRWALRDCTLAIPAGRVVGLVGPNGAGKTTLLHLAVGLLAPTSGTVEILGRRPGDPAELGPVGFVAQETPVYAALSVGDHLRFGAWLNSSWDGELAGRGSSNSAWTQASGPGRSPAASERSSPSPWRSPSGLSFSSSTSRSPVWTRWPGGSSSKTSCRSWPSTESASYSPHI